MKKLFISLLIINFVVLNSQFAGHASTSVKKQKNEIELKNSKILKEQGRMFYEKGDYEKALSFLQNINTDNKDEEVLFLIANCYDHLDDDWKASEYMVKSIEVNDKNAYSFYNLGLLHFNNGNTNAAIKNFENAVKYKEDFAPAHYNLGTSYYLVEKYKKAKSSLEKALKYDSFNPNIYYNLALTYEALSDDKNAKKYFGLYEKYNEQLKSQNN